MNNISSSQMTGSLTSALSATGSKQPGSASTQAFNSSPNVPKQVTPLVQQLLSGKDNKTSEHHHEQPVDYADGAEEYVEFEKTELLTAISGDEDAKQRGKQQHNTPEMLDEEDADAAVDDKAAASVSAAGITVGTAPNTHSRPIPDNRVIAIQGQNYSVAFLKRQVGNFATSSFANSAQEADGSSATQSPINAAWGGANMGGSTSQFESYIRASFPNGDPDIPDNPTVKFEGDNLIVNGQSYGAELNNPALIGGVDSFLITHPPQQQSAVQQMLNTFNEVTVDKHAGQFAGQQHVKVPTEHYGQWQAALQDNLPPGTSVDFAVG